MKLKTSEFEVGDWVWYWYPRRYQRKSAKWQRSYTGPYMIVRVIEPVNYVLQKSARSKPFVVHADKLKKYFDEAPACWLQLRTSTSTKISDVQNEAAEERSLSSVLFPNVSDGACASPENSSLMQH